MNSRTDNCVLTSGVGDVEVGRVVRLERVHLRPQSTVRVEERVDPWAIAFVDVGCSQGEADQVTPNA